MKIRKEKDFISVFDEKTGEYIRTGIIKNGKDTGEDPFMTSFPELLDVGIMGHCNHGKAGLCIKSGVGCYQNGLYANEPNMATEDFVKILKQCEGKVFQIALGGCGDPDQHEDFEYILSACQEHGIVPNFTTSGIGIDEKIASVCKKYCGAVAVSWYRSEYTIKAIEYLIQAGCKTNIHYVLSKSTIEEAFDRLKNSTGKDYQFRNDKIFPGDINAIVFLLHKPVGLGKSEEIITADNKAFRNLIDYIDKNKFPFKIGFDSCTVPALLGTNNIDVESLDTCEGARWSAYISSDMKMMPCSFDNQLQKWSVDIRNTSIKEAWESERFEDFRNNFKTRCSDCKKRKVCLGGCPITPEIVVCQEKYKTPNKSNQAVYLS